MPPPVIGPMVHGSFDRVYEAILGLTGDHFSSHELLQDARRIRKRLLEDDEVASVRICGARGRLVLVEFTPVILQQYHLSAAQLATRIRNANAMVGYAWAQVGPRELASGTVVRFPEDGGEATVTDGPVAEAKEMISYALYQVRSKDEALQWASRFLTLHRDLWPGWEGEADVLKVGLQAMVALGGTSAKMVGSMYSPCSGSPTALPPRTSRASCLPLSI